VFEGGAVARRLSIPAVVVAISVRFSWLRVWMESSEELDWSARRPAGGCDGDLGDHAVDSLGHADDAFKGFASLIGGDDALLDGEVPEAMLAMAVAGAVLDAWIMAEISPWPGR